MFASRASDDRPLTRPALNPLSVAMLLRESLIVRDTRWIGASAFMRLTLVGLGIIYVINHRVLDHVALPRIAFTLTKELTDALELALKTIGLYVVTQPAARRISNLKFGIRNPKFLAGFA